MINKILDLTKELSGLLPMSAEDKERLDSKIRLEFNYNSNHIEGNTLSYGDTQLLLLKGHVSGDHDKRELDEMQAHDLAFSMIKEWAEDKERQLTETDVKTLNKIILVKPFYKEAITEGGQNTKRLIEVGTYKNYPNSVQLANGEMHYYASPMDTPQLMGELMNWYREEENSGKFHPVELAALWHYKFVSIHPFDDGNGRVSRLIMNYILLKADMPPVIIKSADKKKYLQSLNKADTGDIDAFVKYIVDQLEFSLDISIKAARGESIEEIDDWQKELQLLRKKGKDAPSKRDISITKQRILDSVFPLLGAFLGISGENILPLFESMDYKLYSALTDFTTLFKRKEFNADQWIRDDIDYSLFINIRFINYKKNALDMFTINIPYEIKFSDYTYTIKIFNEKHNPLRKAINEPLVDSDIELIINAFGKVALEKIKRELNN